MILLLSYDLIGHERPSEYKRLEEAIKKYAGDNNFVKALYSQWFVDTNLTPEAWEKIMSDATDANDCRIVVTVTKMPIGTYSSSAVDWVKRRFGY